MELQEKYTTTSACSMCDKVVEPYRRETYEIAGGTVTLGLNYCKECGLRFTSPRLNDAGLQLLYNEGYENQTVSGAYNVSEDVSEEEYKAFYGYVTRLLPDGGNVLDVGCGVGLLLERFKGQDKIKIQGIEYSEFAAEKARARGFEVKVGTLEDADYPENHFDGVTILYVLEHVPNPREVLRAIHKVLAPGGVLCLSVPNYRYLRLRGDNPLARLVLGKKASLHPEEHLQNFTPPTMKKMLELEGFTLVEEHAAKPLKLGSPLVRFVKNCAYWAMLFADKLGYSCGGIHMIAKKSA